jgi:hypothetical protein
MTTERASASAGATSTTAATSKAGDFELPWVRASLPPTDLSLRQGSRANTSCTLP